MKDEDGDSVLDSSDLDADNDGIRNEDEGGGLDDTDGDGVLDYADVDVPGFVDADGNGVNDAMDVDGDNIPNALDLNSDGDNISDLEEVGLSVFDQNSDGRIDNITDSNENGLMKPVDPAEMGLPPQLLDTDLNGLPDVYQPALPIDAGVVSQDAGEPQTQSDGGTSDGSSSTSAVTSNCGCQSLATPFAALGILWLRIRTRRALTKR